MTLARFTATKLTSEQTNTLIKNVVTDFAMLPGLQAILLFGSAANETMTTASDIDILLVLDTKENVALSRKLFPSLRKHSTWPMDLLCIDVETFKQKSQIGGICFVARTEGKVIFGEIP